VAGFSSYDDFLNELTVNGKVLEADFAKYPTAGGHTGFWYSWWRDAGVPSAGGDGAVGSGTPGAGGTALSSTSASPLTGALNAWADVSTDTKHLLAIGLVSSQDCSVMLYDRLVSVSAVTVASTGDKNVGSAALPRYSGTASVGVEVWAEVTTATATTAPIISLKTYTDQDGNTGSVGGTITFPTAITKANTLVGPFPLAAGDTGVRSVETINVATAGSAGAVNIVLLKPLGVFTPLVAGVGASRDFMFQLPSLPRIYDGATLGIAQFASQTGAVNVYGKIVSAYG
jgi:hypothetical protein